MDSSTAHLQQMSFGQWFAIPQKLLVPIRPKRLQVFRIARYQNETVRALSS
jgi:hypothetical protein